jgi:hypothetical protein
MKRSLSIGFYRGSESASSLAREAKEADATWSVVVLGSIYTEGVAPETPVLFLYDEFDAASVRGDSPVVVRVDTETVEAEMIRAMQPTCAQYYPALLRLPHTIPKMLAAIKAAKEVEEVEEVEADQREAVEAAQAAGACRGRVLVIVDPLPGPSTTTHLMLMSCDTVVVPFDGTRESCSALRLFLHLVPSWLDHYKPILRSHRPRFVVFATRPEPEMIALAKKIASGLFPSASVVAGPIEALLAHIASV